MPPVISPVVKQAPEAHIYQPWWRHGMLWLVIGGPALVVVASLITAFIAIRGADPVLSREEPGAVVNPKEGVDAMTPAVQARNHAATPKP